MSPYSQNRAEDTVTYRAIFKDFFGLFIWYGRICSKFFINKNKTKNRKRIGATSSKNIKLRKQKHFPKTIKPTPTLLIFQSY